MCKFENKLNQFFAKIDKRSDKFGITKANAFGYISLTFFIQFYQIMSFLSSKVIEELQFKKKLLVPSVNVLRSKEKGIKAKAKLNPSANVLNSKEKQIE
jgi:hypothetical protein